VHYTQGFDAQHNAAVQKMIAAKALQLPVGCRDAANSMYFSAHPPHLLRTFMDTSQALSCPFTRP
jgi:hypothetical protein